MPKTPTLAEATHAAAGRARPKTVSRAGSSRAGRRAIVIYVPRDLHRRLRRRALDEDSSMQALGLAALERAAAGHGD